VLINQTPAKEKSSIHLPQPRAAESPNASSQVGKRVSSRGDEFFNASLSVNEALAYGNRILNINTQLCNDISQDVDCLNAIQIEASCTY
jgi:hypothetical protein